MRIQVRLFAILRELTKLERVELELPEASTVAQASDLIGRHFPGLKVHLPRVAFAVNQAYVSAETVLNDGDELALIPPVSGG